MRKKIIRSFKRSPLGKPVPKSWRSLLPFLWGSPRAKRAFDLFASSLLIVMSAPLMALIALLVKLDSPGPILYSQVRVGLNRRRRSHTAAMAERRRLEGFGQGFRVLKFRSMRTDAEANGPQWCRQNDPRVTRFGSFLRKSHLDELPQLFNVFNGDMSLVGPRPERPEFIAHLRQAVEGYERRLHLKPGLTGLAQIYKGPDEVTDDVRVKMRYDLLYMKNSSVYTDMKIVLATIPLSLGLPLTKPPARKSARPHNPGNRVPVAAQQN